MHPAGDPADPELPLPGEVLVRPDLHLHPHRGPEQGGAAGHHRVPGRGRLQDRSLAGEREREGGGIPGTVKQSCQVESLKAILGYKYPFLGQCICLYINLVTKIVSSGLFFLSCLVCGVGPIF